MLLTCKSPLAIHYTENLIYKGLDDEESVFLTMVADRRAEHEADIIRTEISEVSAYRVCVINSSNHTTD